MECREFTYQYDGQAIPCSLWVTSKSVRLTTVVFLGTVQIGELPRWVAEHCPPNTAVLQGAPHWLAKADGSDILAFMREYTVQALNHIIQNYQVKQFNIIAESQAVPGIIQVFARKKFTPYPRALVLVQPLGLNYSTFAGTKEQRVQAFFRRVMRNGRYQLADLLLDKRLRYSHRQLSRLVDFRTSIAREQYGSGLAHSSLPELAKLQSLCKNLWIVSGSNDKIFPPTEIKTQLKEVGLSVPVRVIEGVPHSPLATRKGRRLLCAAFDCL
nr:hypothetical protein [Candidatus Saccharibacteria bacterium]